MNHDKSGILSALDDEFLIDVPESASALINITGDFNGQIEVTGSTALSDFATLWGARNVSPDYSTNIITNDGSPISAEYRIVTGGQSVRLKMIAYTSGFAGVRVVSTHYPSVVEIGNPSAISGGGGGGGGGGNDGATETTLSAINSYFKEEDTPAISGDKGIPLLAQRFAADTPTTSNDGDYTLLKLDEEGRLKVSTKPASYADITGDITAVQASISVPVAGGTVSGDVSRASNIMIFCTGTFSTVNCTFEGSLEASGDTNWFGVQVVRSNANTIETATGNLSAQPAYAWEASVNALKRFRVRCTARTSGTQSWRFVQGTYATEPIPAAQVTATQPVSGSVTSTLAAATVRAGFIAGAGIWFDDSSTALAANATFTGTSRDLTVTATATAFANAATYAKELRVSAESDVSGTLWLEVSRDNTNWRRVKSVATAAVTGGGQYAEIVHRPSWRYARVGFTNGATIQARFSIGSLLMAV
jgi:hypothetical protein